MQFLWLLKTTYLPVCGLHGNPAILFHVLRHGCLDGCIESKRLVCEAISSIVSRMMPKLLRPLPPFCTFCAEKPNFCFYGLHSWMVSWTDLGTPGALRSSMLLFCNNRSIAAYLLNTEKFAGLYGCFWTRKCLFCAPRATLAMDCAFSTEFAVQETIRIAENSLWRPVER